MAKCAVCGKAGHQKGFSDKISQKPGRASYRWDRLLSAGAAGGLFAVAPSPLSFISIIVKGRDFLPAFLLSASLQFLIF